MPPYSTRADIRRQSDVGDNSTVTELSASATFTGSWEPDHRPTLEVEVYSSHAGTLYIDHSDDAGTTSTVHPAAGYAIAAGERQTVRIARQGLYSRIRFVNGGTTQTTFWLYTYFSSADHDIAPMPYDLAVAAGLVHGAAIHHADGFNTDVDAASAAEDIHDGGGAYAGLPFDTDTATTAETLDIVSSDTADDAASTGARTLYIAGLDENGVEQTEIVTLDGTTEVVTTSTWYRVNEAYVLTAGSGGTNAGTITVTHTTTTANVFAAIPIGQGRARIAAYTVPAGKQGILRKRAARSHNVQSGGTATELTLALRRRKYQSDIWEFSNHLVLSNLEPVIDDTRDVVLEALEDVVDRATTASADNLDVRSSFEVLTF